MSDPDEVEHLQEEVCCLLEEVECLREDVYYLWGKDECLWEEPSDCKNCHSQTQQDQVKLPGVWPLQWVK